MNNNNLFHILQERFPREDATAFELADGRTIGYGELRAAAARIANLLVSLGAKPGDRIAAQVEKSVSAAFLYLGALQAGCVFLPLNPAYQRGELSYLLGDAQPRVFVTRPDNRAMAEEFARELGIAHTLVLDDQGGGELMDAASAQPARFATVMRAADDLAAILYTSGTTGRPKGAMLSHRNLSVGVRVLHGAWGFQPQDVLLHILPLYHFHGLFVALHCALYNGSSVFFETRFDARRAVELLRRSTVCMGVPTHYSRLLAEPALEPEACTGMRLFISGSAPLLPSVFTAFHERTGHTILERYGMTEGGMFASNPYEGERRSGTVGKALPGISLRVADKDDRPVAAGATGGVQVKGESVFTGYWKLPEKTAQEHTGDGYFRTGDLGVLSEDGYLTIVGRDKDLIISGGLNVYPKEIEAVIDALPGVKESAVIGIQDGDFGEAVTAIVVKEAAAATTADEVIQAVRANLAGFKVPKKVHFVDDLPRNAMGKVQKNQLRAQF